MRTICSRSVKLLLRRTFIFIPVICLVYVGYNHIISDGYYTQQCQIQRPLDDKSIRRHFWVPGNVKCYSWPELVYLNSSGFLHFNQSAAPWPPHDQNYLRCKYSIIYLFGINEARFYEFHISSFPLQVNRDFIHVSCNINDTTVYANFLYNVNPKVNGRHLMPESEEQLNLFIFGFDSVSRYLAEKKLRKTLEVLEKDLKAYRFEGYARVGDNTFPNLLAALTGKTIAEAIFSRSENTLYSEVLKRGYIDCHAEDWATYYPPLIVSYPNYTHYLRTFFFAREIPPLKILKKGRSYEDLQNVVDPKCYGNQLQHKIILDYSRKCIQQYRQARKFVFFWQNEISHHQPNFLSLADKDTADLITWMRDHGHLKNSVLILMSDHGPRYGPIARHELGMITRNLPLLTIYLPESMKQKYPHIHKNLLTNKMRLTTPFDLHETMKDILFQNFKRENFSPLSALPRGISLFQEIPKYRSCYDASISENYCPCYSYAPLDVQTPIVQKSAGFAVIYINLKLFNSKLPCTNLGLHSIHSAKLQRIPQKKYSTKEVQLTVIFETTPGHAIFQATVRTYSQSIDSMKIVGEIERVNTYGNQSRCVPSGPLNKQYRFYCYCK
ncbi:uncharacterized protein LOC133183625 [Saccostrea echinata]|uniref:uncharacterized protein LOC133183625 n=1 Tax=Saccostrea echinata TaxID=191078 RepID=UPI002A81451D|nr:uncharacterized protein LOC133183625 [Saccostrea echinata]